MSIFPRMHACPHCRCSLWPSLEQFENERQDADFKKFDCHYNGDINVCDKDCKQLGACKRRTAAPGREG